MKLLLPFIFQIWMRCFCVLLPVLTLGSSIPIVDPTFYSGLGSDETIYSMVVQPDGKILIGGRFQKYDGVNRSGIARLLPDGQLDTSFDPGLGMGGQVSLMEGGLTIYALALQPDGKIIVGGEFTTFNGIDQNRLTRLNPDGSVDPGFKIGTGVSGAPSIPIDIGFYGTNIANYPARYIKHILIEPDGNILLGGKFIAFNDLPQENLVRLFSNGEIDTVFQSNFTFYRDDSVEALARFPDGNILVGKTPMESIVDLIKVDSQGKQDPTFQPNISPGFSATQIVPLTNGQILIAGRDIWAPGTPSSVVRLLNNGTVDSNLLFQTAGAISRVRLLTDGSILIGGQLGHSKGQVQINVARLLPTGAWDYRFDSCLMVVPGFNDNFPAVRCMELTSDEKMLIAGSFTNINGIKRMGIARINLNTRNTEAVAQFVSSGIKVSNDETQALITVMLTQPENKRMAVEYSLRAGTAISSVDFTPVSGLIQFAPGEQYKTIVVPVHYNSAVTVDRTAFLELKQLSGNVSLGVPSKMTLIIQKSNAKGLVGIANATFTNNLPLLEYVNQLAIQPDGNILLTTGRLMRMNSWGQIDKAFMATAGMVDGVNCFAITTNQQILVGGVFKQWNGVARPGFARLNVDGSLDKEFAPLKDGLNTPGSSMGYISQITVLNDGKILLNGGFNLIRDEWTYSQVARVTPDGALDVTYRPDLEGINRIYGVAIQKDGKLLIEAAIADKSYPNGNILRLDNTGARDLSFTPQTGFGGFAFRQQDDGKILLASGKWLGDNPAVPIISRLYPDGSLDTNFVTPAHFRDSFYQDQALVDSLAIQPDGKVLAAGIFNYVNEIPQSNLVRLNADGSLDLGFQLEVPSDEINLTRVRQIYLQGSDSLLVCLDYFNLNGTPENSQSIYRYDLKESNEPARIQLSYITNVVEEKSGGTQIDVVRLGNASTTSTVNYDTVPGTATEDVDFTALSGIMTFAPGERSHSLFLPIINDPWVETNETFKLELNQPSANSELGTPALVNFEIVDDDSAVEFSPTQYQVSELATTLSVHVHRMGLLNGPLHVDYFTRDGTAKAGLNYLPVSGTLTFDWWGDVDQNIDIPILDDTVAEGNKTFQIVLSNASGWVLGPNVEAQVTILDNDLPNKPGMGADGPVFQIVEENDGHAIVAGQFSHLNGFVRQSIARLNPDNSLDEQFQAGLNTNATVTKFAVDQNKRILLTGNFTNIDGVVIRNLARLLPDGRLDRSFTPTLDVPEPLQAFNIADILVLKDGHTLIGGYYVNMNGLYHSLLVCLQEDGSINPSFVIPDFQASYLGSMITSFITLPNDQIMVGGTFTQVSGAVRNGLVRLNSDGSLDGSFDPQLPGGMSEEGVYPNGS